MMKVNVLQKHYFFDHNRKYGTKIKVARIFNTYGPNMRPDDGRVISSFILQALNNINITIYGNGNQTRSFCYVDDLINGIYKLMNSNNNVIGPINIGNTVEFTILELAKLVLQSTKSKSRITFNDLPQDDPLQRRPVIDEAKIKLDWQPNIILQDGLVKTIAYFTKTLKKK